MVYVKTCQCSSGLEPDIAEFSLTAPPIGIIIQPMRSLLFQRHVIGIITWRQWHASYEPTFLCHRTGRRHGLIISSHGTASIVGHMTATACIIRSHVPSPGTGHRHSIIMYVTCPYHGGHMMIGKSNDQWIWSGGRAANHSQCITWP